MKMRKQYWKNPFFIVGTVIGVCMLICGIYGVYDCVTDQSIFWPGIRGALVLMVVEPMLLFLLGLDMVVWFVYKNKKRKSIR